MRRKTRYLLTGIVIGIMIVFTMVFSALLVIDIQNLMYLLFVIVGIVVIAIVSYLYTQM